MSQTTQISQTKFNELLNRMSRLENMVAKLLEKSDQPVEGSDAWWKLSDKKALEDIKKGKYTVVHDANELQQHLDSLKK